VRIFLKSKYSINNLKIKEMQVKSDFWLGAIMGMILASIIWQISINKNYVKKPV
jgi:hypothetical protein